MNIENCRDEELIAELEYRGYTVDHKGLKSTDFYLEKAIQKYKSKDIPMTLFYLELTFPELYGLEKIDNMIWRPISEAPEYTDYRQYILCRFWYPYIDGHWIYFTALAQGPNTSAPGFAPPEEFCLLPMRKDHK